MTNKDVASEKNAIRNSLRQQRTSRNYDPALATELNIHLAELCLANGAKRIACYLPYGDEPDVELFLDWAIENEIEILLPVVKADGLLDWVIFEGVTTTGLLGFAEASGENIKPIDVDIAIIPALAISRAGIRLGKGKGFYDRALPDFKPLPPVVAVIYEEELVDSLPNEPHDQPVDAVVTPSGITHFTNRLK